MREVKRFGHYHSDYAFEHHIESLVTIRCAECNQEIGFRFNNRDELDILALPHACPVDEMEVEGTEAA